jgi:ABC-type nitrate/sulfonate/bicarbonate transport system permease component
MSWNRYASFVHPLWPTDPDAPHVVETCWVQVFSDGTERRHTERPLGELFVGLLLGLLLGVLIGLVAATWIS